MTLCVPKYRVPNDDRWISFFHEDAPMNAASYAELCRLAEERWTLVGVTKTVNIIANGPSVALDAVLTTRPEGVSVQVWHASNNEDFEGYVPGGWYL